MEKPLRGRVLNQGPVKGQVGEPGRVGALGGKGGGRWGGRTRWHPASQHLCSQHQNGPACTRMSTTSIPSTVQSLPLLLGRAGIHTGEGFMWPQGQESNFPILPQRS